jgi:hypothetical protein
MVLASLCDFHKFPLKKNTVQSEILKKILSFNSPRINFYLNVLKAKNIVDCLEYCQLQTDTAGKLDCPYAKMQSKANKRYRHLG